MIRPLLATALLALAATALADPADRLRGVEAAYTAGSIALPDYQALFAVSNSRQLHLDALVEGDGYTAATYIVALVRDGRAIVDDGLALIDWAADGTPARIRHVSLSAIPDLDQALAGQGADLITTAAGLAGGLVEINPVAAPMLLAKAAALGTDLDYRQCVETRLAAARVGWAAAAWNLIILAGAGLPTGLAAALAGYSASGGKALASALWACI